MGIKSTPFSWRNFSAKEWFSQKYRSMKTSFLKEDENELEVKKIQKSGSKLHRHLSMIYEEEEDNWEHVFSSDSTDKI